MILIQLAILLLLLYIIFILSYSMLRGAPFAALGRDRILTMMQLLDVKSGKKLVDLGSGDGRIVHEAAKLKVHAYGYEINPFIYLVSKIKLRKMKNAKIELADLWKQDLSQFDYVTVWGVPPMMGRLEKKLRKELKKGAKVVSNHNRFPNWKYSKNMNDVYLYIK